MEKTPFGKRKTDGGGAKKEEKGWNGRLEPRVGNYGGTVARGIREERI